CHPEPARGDFRVAVGEPLHDRLSPRLECSCPVDAVVQIDSKANIVRREDEADTGPSVCILLPRTQRLIPGTPSVGIGAAGATAVHLKGCLGGLAAASLLISPDNPLV